jgi:hypothetical protein
LKEFLIHIKERSEDNYYKGIKNDRLYKTVTPVEKMEKRMV